MSGRHARKGHRYPRSGLADHEQRPPTYFVPAYAVRRDVAPDDEQIKPFLRAVRRRLNSHYTVVHRSKICLDIIEKPRFIEQMREAGLRPSAEEMRDLALSTREGLRDLTADAPPGLELPLGKIARFGARQNLLGIVPAGWRGYRAHYARRDAHDQPLALGTVVAENQLSLGAITAAMSSHPRFVVDGLAQTPHLLLATHNGSIPDHELWAIQDRLECVAPPALRLADPIIYLSNRVGQGKPELIYVRDQPEIAAPPAPSPIPTLRVE